MNNTLETQIASIKEAMVNMPRNNIKNKNKYKEYIESILIEATELKEKIYKEINDRYQSIIIKSKNNNEIETDPRIEKYKEYINLSNNYNTSYEKSHLDRIIDEITRFNQDDLNKINEDIKKCIVVFNNVGVKLTNDSFNYSIYTNKYMKLFLDELNNSNLDNDKLKQCFEEIYWQCPDLIIEIAFNLSHLYYQNKKQFDRYYNNELEKVEKELNITEKEINSNLKIATRNNYLNTRNNLNNIISRFLNKEYNINDYSQDKINSYYAQIGSNEGNIELIDNLLTTLKEYRYYKDNLHIIDDIKNIYKEKAKYKDAFKNKLKEITKTNNKIIGLTKKYFSKEKSKLFNNKEKLEKILLDSENEIINIKKSYEELELDKFNELVFTLTDANTLYDLLKIASSYYIYLKKLIEKNNEGISIEEINKKVEELELFINSFDINIISNISINEERDIPTIISDKYKLLGINITNDVIDNSLDTTIDTLEKILLKNIIDKSNIKYEDIEFLCNSNEIINK